MTRSFAVTLTFLAITLVGCASTGPEQPSAEQTRLDLQRFMATQGIGDERGRFREIYCAVLEERKDELPDSRPCDQALRNTGNEQGATGRPTLLGKNKTEFLVLLVPGLGWECFESWLDITYSSPAHVAGFGYDVRTIPVDGLSSSNHNARLISDYVTALSGKDARKPIVLAGYSKGAPDILEAVVNYPDLARRVVAVVSIAGAIQGSPLAVNASQAQANMLSVVPGAKCEKNGGDNDGVASLHPQVRALWLQQNTLPEHINYYSVVTFPNEDRVSRVLRNSYALLGQSEPRNDTQLTIFDQIIPGSSILALVNADHWAVSVPVGRSHPMLGSTMVDKNDYPREALMEAMMRFLDEALATDSGRDGER